MKKIVIACSLGGILLLIFLTFQLYPTRKTVLQGKYYNLANSVFDNAINVEITPSNIHEVINQKR